MQSAPLVKNMNKTRYRGLLVASTGVFAGALAVSAAVLTIQPPPSGYADTEGSTNVVFAPLLEDTRQYVVRFAGDFSPSNNLEFAIGGDANGDGDLSPEEIEARFGVDCGEKKVKVRCEQGGSGILSASEQESNIHCSPSTFTLKLTRDQQTRWNLIKVTRRGFFSSEPSVTLKPHRPGMMIIVR